MDKNDTLFIIFILTISIFLFSTLTPGFRVTDESTYFLMVKSYVVDGHHHILNGFEYMVSAEFIMPSTEIVSNGIEYRIYGIPAPLYSYFAAPFFTVFGPIGLNLMNSISFIISVIILNLICRLYFSKYQSAVTAILYSLSYPLQYSQMVWPHSLATMFILASAYFILYQYGKSETGFPFFFASGFLIASAVGLRYPLGLFFIVDVFFIFIYMRKALMSYLIGFSIPAFTVFYLNKTFFGSFLSTSYVEWYVESLIIATFGMVVVSVLLIMYAQKTSLLSKIKKEHAIFFALLFMLLSFTVPIVGKAGHNLYSGLFDMSALHPDYPVYKKALLQSIPYLFLALYAPIKMYKRIGAPATVFSAMGFAQILLLPFMSFGGVEESHGMRYLIDSVPFLIILAVYSIFHFMPNLGKWDFYMVFFFMILVVYSYTDVSLIHVNEGVLYYLPNFLVVGILLTSLLQHKNKGIYTFFCIFLFLSVSYSIAVGVADLRSMTLIRNLVWGSSLNLVKAIPDGSAIYYIDRGDYPYLVTLKYFRQNITLVLPPVDLGESLSDVILNFHEMGSNQYFIYKDSEMWLKENEMWINSTKNFIDENNLTNVYHYSYSKQK